MLTKPLLIRSDASLSCVFKNSTGDNCTRLFINLSTNLRTYPAYENILMHFLFLLKVLVTNIGYLNLTFNKHKNQWEMGFFSV